MGNIIFHGGNVWEAERASEAKFNEFLDFSSNINPLGLSKKINHALTAAKRKLIYYPDPGYLRLRKELSGFLDIGYDFIFPGNGLSEIIDLVSRSLDFKAAVIVEPTYREYEVSVVKSRHPVRRFLLHEKNAFSMDKERFYKILCGNKRCAFFLCNPNNPTGTLVERGFLASILKKIISNRHYLVIDEAFIDFTSSGRNNSAVPFIKTCPRLIVLWSLTKIFAFPGLRFGAALADKSIIRRLNEASYPWNVNVVAEEAASACLRDKKYLEDTRAVTAGEREYLSGELKKIKSLKVYPSEANFLLIKILDREICAGALNKKLFRHKILIRDCSNFYSLNRYFFRIAVKDRGANKRLVSALTRYLG